MTFICNFRITGSFSHILAFKKLAENPESGLKHMHVVAMGTEEFRQKLKDIPEINYYTVDDEVAFHARLEFNINNNTTKIAESMCPLACTTGDLTDFEMGSGINPNKLRLYDEDKYTVRVYERLASY